MSFNHSVVSDSVTPWTIAHQAPCPWNFLGKHTGVGCCFLLQVYHVEKEKKKKPSISPCQFLPISPRKCVLGRTWWPGEWWVIFLFPPSTLSCGLSRHFSVGVKGWGTSQPCSSPVLSTSIHSIHCFSTTWSCDLRRVSLWTREFFRS